MKSARWGLGYTSKLSVPVSSLPMMLVNCVPTKRKGRRVSSRSKIKVQVCVAVLGCSPGNHAT